MFVNSLSWLALLAAMVIVPGRLQAASYTWDITPGIVGAGNGVIDDGSGMWDATNGNWTLDGGLNNVAWPNNATDVAIFGGSQGGIVVVDGDKVAAGISFAGTLASGFSFSSTGVSTLTNGTAGITVGSAAGAQTFDATLALSLSGAQTWVNNSPGTLTIGGPVSGGFSFAKGGTGTVALNANNTVSGSLTVNGGGILDLNGQNTFAGSINIGDTSASNTMNSSGKLTSGTSLGYFNVGRNAFGSNSADISGVGNSTIQTVYLSGNSSSFWVGGEGSPSCGNRLVIRNGAYFRAAGGNGTTNSKMGSNAGSTNNSITVTGVNSGTGDRSTLSHSGQRFYVGESGSWNTLAVSAGGHVLLRVFHVGAGGSDNMATISDIGSYLQVTEDLLIGNGTGGTNNSVIVSNGASVNSQTRTGRTEISCNIGTATGANNNSLTVSGAGSTWTDNGYHVVIGGTGTPSAPAWQDARDNSLNIYSDAAATINTGLILSGTRSSFNLGDGNGISTASVGSARDGSIVLSVADARMNIHGGRLNANVSGALVSGAGQINANGQAIFSTVSEGNSIDCVIAGTGTVTKVGSGTLRLSAINSYTGDTTVSNGVLQIDNPCLWSESDVIMAAGSMMNLNFTGTNTIRALFLDGTQQRTGLFGASVYRSDFFTGAGLLLVTEPPPTPKGSIIIVR